MMSKEFLKKIGILGVSFGLIASPLAFADVQDDEYVPKDPAPQEEPAPDVNSNNEFDNDEFETEEYDTEYEDEEQASTFDEQDDEEWDTTDDDEKQSW